MEIEGEIGWLCNCVFRSNYFEYFMRNVLKSFEGVCLEKFIFPPFLNEVLQWVQMYFELTVDDLRPSNIFVLKWIQSINLKPPSDQNWLKSKSNTNKRYQRCKPLALKKYLCSVIVEGTYQNIIGMKYQSIWYTWSWHKSSQSQVQSYQIPNSFWNIKIIPLRRSANL